MEFGFFIIEAILWCVDLVISAFDLYAWFKGRPNRLARRAARTTGAAPPPRDLWNRRFLLLTLLAAILTASLVLWRSTRLT